ncbi:hypothetical protein [Phaffia rhodozyma]|uniref:Uncharacterized protein n=1 Tax=Phaffia rhodozyma TaxID=264483 RepID=A0A0F7SXX2_PHARH|nr:hypothetical protein [Phaffia rhodozyma]
MALNLRVINRILPSVSTGFAPTDFKNMPTMKPDPFRPDVNAHLTLFQEIEQDVPTRKDLPRITFAMSNLGAPPLLPTITSSTEVQPVQSSTVSPLSDTTTMTSIAKTTTSRSSLATTSSSVSSVSSKASISSTSDHGLYRIASTASLSRSSQSISLTSDIPSTDMSRNGTSPEQPNVPAILLGCLLVFIILTLVGSSLSWCFFSKNQRRRRQQEQFWIHDEERNGLDSHLSDQVSHKSTVGQWNRAGEGDMTEVSLASPILNRRGPGYRSPILPTSTGIAPNPMASTIPTPSSPLPQAATLTTTTSKRSYAQSAPSVQDYPAQSDGKKLVVVNSAPGDASSSDSESLIGPRKVDGGTTHSRRWKL